MTSVISYFITLSILTIVLWALDKYKHFRVDTWKNSFILSTIYWVTIGLPIVYVMIPVQIMYLPIVFLIGIPFSAISLNVAGLWIVYPFLDKLKENKNKFNLKKHQ